MDERPARLRELFRLFLWLGCVAFGGPAAHLALMEDECVRRRGWLSAGEFADLLGATSLLPGPNSTQMALQIGRLRAGLAGLFVAGACFIGPAAVSTAALAWAYQRYGGLRGAEALIAGLKPVVVGLVAAVLPRVAKAALKSWREIAIALAALTASLLGAGALPTLAAGALAGMVLRAPVLSARALVAPLAAAGASAIAAPTLGSIAAFFLTVGSALYGSGYVLIAYLRSGLVVERGWITERQLLDAVAFGQATPGPVSTAATFIGWLLAGPAGALVATLAIFAPSFALIALTGPLVPRLRASRLFGGILDGANAASLGLLGAVVVLLARDAFLGPLAAALALGAFGLAAFTRVNATWLLLIGGAAGVLRGLV